MIDIKSDNIEVIEENIIVVKNFIKEEEISGILNFCKSSTEEDWQKADSDNGYNKGPGWQGRNILYDFSVTNSIKDRCNNLLFDKYDIVGFGMLHRMLPGIGMAAHHDDPFGKVAYGIVAYFNNDYEGGILRYVNQNIEYRPSAGDMIIHKAQSDYTHEVTPVISGARYYTTAFAYFRG